MRISILAVGRMKAGPERDMLTRYLDRGRGLGKTLGLTGFDVSEHPESRAGSSSRRKQEEARALQASRAEGSVLVCMDERGKSVNSEQFSGWISTWRDMGRTNVSFVIGGADGLDPELVAQADQKLCFSPLTWPHQLVRIMLAEQLYRATTIIAGHPYHRGD